MLSWTLVLLLIYNTALLLKYCGDYIILKTRLQYFQPMKAKIIDIDYIQYTKGQVPLTIVSFKKNGRSQDTIISYRKNDKVGDELEIVTDGFYAVRTKQNISIFTILMEEAGLLLGAVCFGYIGCNLFGGISFLFVWVVAIACFVGIVCYPVYATSYNKSLKKRLGWHEYVKGNDVQQQTDDLILIAVAVGAMVIMMIVVCLITNG